MKERLSEIEAWNAQNIQQCIHHYSEESELKLGKIAPPIRVAVCGSASSPSIDVTLALVGQARVISRIDQAINYISSQVEGS